MIDPIIMFYTHPLFVILNALVVAAIALVLRSHYHSVTDSSRWTIANKGSNIADEIDRRRVAR